MALTAELHVVDVKSSRTYGYWEVHLSSGKAMHVHKDEDCPDELSAYVYVTNRIKEIYNGTNSRA